MTHAAPVACQSQQHAGGHIYSHANPLSPAGLDPGGVNLDKGVQALSNSQGQLLEAVAVNPLGFNSGQHWAPLKEPGSTGLGLDLRHTGQTKMLSVSSWQAAPETD